MKQFFRFLISKKGAYSLFCYLSTAVFAQLAFAPFSQSYFVWLAPIGLFAIEKRYRGDWSALVFHGFGFAIVFYCVSFHWIYHMVTVFGGFPWFLAFPIFVLSGIFLNFKFPIFLLIFSFLVTRLQRWFPWIAGFSMLAAEFIAPQVFPWYFGSIVGENLILSQNAEYTSAYGLTVLLFTFSYFLFSVFSYRRIKSRFLLLKKRLFGGSHRRFDAKLNRILFGFSSILVFFLLFWANGYLLLRKWANVKPVAQKQVLVIQPNAPLEFRDGRSVVEEIRLLMERIDQLSLAAAKKQPLDLIVLPESGVPFFSAHKHEATEAAGIYWPKFELFIKTLALRHGANVFFNELDVEFAKDSIRRSDMLTYNSSALYSPQGERKTSYQKVYLLIFGEYMPFEWMYALSGQTGKFAKGESLALIPYYEPLRNNENLTDITWGDLDYFNENSLKEYYQKKIQAEQQVGSFLPLICYEVIIPEYVRQFQGDPDFIVNVTNDKWYGPTIQSFQHHTLGRMRAIEFRKWLVRSTNSGTSVFTDHLGRNVDGDFTPIESSASLLKTVDVIPGEITFYRKYGNLLTWIYLLLSSLFFFYYGKQRTQFH